MDSYGMNSDHDEVRTSVEKGRQQTRARIRPDLKSKVVSLSESAQSKRRGGRGVKGSDCRNLPGLIVCE
jgi:hypothetical protein